jgi:hypothetical protein
VPPRSTRTEAVTFSRACFSYFSTKCDVV